MSDEKIYIFGAIHQAVVTVDEEGIEPAAVTIAMCRRHSFVRIEYKEFYLHTPFIYGIKNMSNDDILFIGDYHSEN